MDKVCIAELLVILWGVWFVGLWIPRTHPIEDVGSLVFVTLSLCPPGLWLPPPPPLGVGAPGYECRE